MRWCRLIAENYFPFQSRSEKKAHLPAHTNIAQTPSGGVKTPLTVHVGETDEQHSWNSGTCDGRQRERGREMTVCLWIKSSMLMQPALGCVLTNYQSCKSKKEQLILNIRSIFIFISAKRVKLEISIRFNSLSQAPNAAFLCICHTRK